MTSASDTSTSVTDHDAALTGAGLDRPLVSTQWLADHLGADGLVVLDATVVQTSRADGRTTPLSGLDQFLVDGHVPGAVFADLLDVFSDPSGPYPFTRPQIAAFEAAAASVGVDNHTTVVVYDAAVGTWAARVWWLFRAFGYDRVAVLDGGLTKWKADGRPLEVGHVEPRPVSGFLAVERPEFWADKELVSAVVTGEQQATLVCAVPPKEFTGEAGQRARLGHIPGSLSAPAGRLVSRETNAFLPPDRLRETFAEVLASDDPIVTYCAGGIAAAADALALALLGRADVALYDGSLNEWSADADAPLVPQS
ncbi:sulfurtransferase [Leifsonia poae]|uniref:sulfurtransferase n=1 Tax=Leifsonia poae TaxID=110933 RepID=UPI001CC139CA|nr:rhodanese-like domain-containing protein [Leifsonia poae]